jgi:thiamine-phosphate pyrophosphorylase
VRRKITPNKVLRVLDANYNRAKEGLRVCEDAARFLLDERVLSAGFKRVRHALADAMRPLGLKGIVTSRDIKRDVGKGTISSERKRKGIADVFYANAQRVKESLRVLEEFVKIVSPDTSEKFKRLRYSVYELEKKVLGRL